VGVICPISLGKRTGWADIWSARNCWSGMPSTVIWRWKVRMKTRWISCEGIQLLTASPWVPYKKEVRQGVGWSENGHWRENGQKKTAFQGDAP